jgi:hypothetical protein
MLREVASGAKTDPAQLRRVLAQLDAGKGSPLLAPHCNLNTVPSSEGPPLRVGP